MTTRRTGARRRAPLVVAAAFLFSALSLRGSMQRAASPASDTLAYGTHASFALDTPTPPASVAAASQAAAPPFTFAACLLLQDDNKILPEWLAYHFHTLPLRHLVVSADRGNVTSPEGIFDQWRGMGMRIEVWPGVNETGHVTGRHMKFLPQCLNYFQSVNQTWTMLIDTDEYIVFNHVMENEPVPDSCDEARLGTNNATMRRECIHQVTASRRILPEVGRKTAAEYIHENARDNPQLWNKFPCITLPRVFFGSHESTSAEISAAVPYGINTTMFMTTRYRKFKFIRKPGKSIVDATRYDGIDRGIATVHRVMKEKCSSPTPFPRLSDALFRVHHYTPSLEVFLGRPNDWRRTVEDYQGRTNFKPTGSDDGIRGWLSSFVSSVGTEKALELTEHSIKRSIAEDAKIKERLVQKQA